MYINSFDSYISQHLNHFAKSFPHFNSILLLFENDQMLKGLPIILILWGYWFYRGNENAYNRSVIITTIFSAFLAIFLARFIAILLPFRYRPILDPSVHFIDTTETKKLMHWSSFPSDHATFFMAIAIGIFFLSRKVGIAVFLFTLFVILIPRIILGYHWTTDIIAGMILGGGMSWILLRSNSIREWISAKPLEWSERYPATFYMCFFFISYQMATMFEGFHFLLSSLHRL